MRSLYYIIKRILGLIFAILGLILLLPLFLIIALSVKLESKGPVFFRQERTGKDGKTFKIYKFRTMVAENDFSDSRSQDKHTKIGSFLRETSLDELPQLFNIIRGEMAFIGPRPWVTEYYENMNERERGRCAVLPGITGLAQTNGRNSLSVFEKISYDLEYVEKFSFREDLHVIFATISAVLKRTAADAGKGVIYSELDQLKAENARI